MMIWQLLLSFPIAFLGALCARFTFNAWKKKNNYIGTIRILDDPDEGSYMFFELSCPLENLKDGEVITADISRKRTKNT